MGARLLRVITGFSRTDDSLVFRYEFGAEYLDRARAIVAPDDDDPEMILVYPLNAAKRDALARLLGVSLDEDLDYFVEADAVT